MSPRDVKQIQIFLGSPGDVSQEREIVKSVVEEINNTIATAAGAHVKLIMWETDTYPTLNLDGIQEEIYRQLGKKGLSIVDCDIFIGIFWQRLGTPTKNASSGTEDEIWTAYSSHEKTRKPKISIYRSIMPPPDLLKDLTIEKIQQLEKLHKFITNEKVTDMWLKKYSDIKEFEKEIRRNLTEQVREILQESSKPDKDEYDMEAQKWEELSYEDLTKYYVNLPEEIALRFFDGRDPRWRESISPSVARREVVTEITRAIQQKNIAHPYIVLLKGLGGEGKSTALQQAIYETVVNQNDISILWHEDINSPLDLKILEDIAQTKKEWIIASDEAHNLIDDLIQADKLIRRKEIENIRFMLAVNENEWKKVDKNGLLPYADIKSIDINKFTEEDAKRIVEKWEAYGETGLGKLSQVNHDQAIGSLYNYAHAEGINKTSLLGAMLKARTGKALLEHLRPSLNALEEKKVVEIKRIENFSLRRAMAYISALHAYDIKLLTKQILAHSLQCSEEILEEKVLIPLGEDIATRPNVLIRHTSIAKATKEILKESYGDLFFTFTRDLLKSAIVLLKDKATEFEIKRWLGLPKIIFEKGDHQMGIELAEEALETYLNENGKYRYNLVNELTSLCRKAGQIKKAVKIHREKYHNTELSRSYYYEWSVSEGRSNHHHISIWLTGLSLADGNYDDNNDPNRIFLSLSGFAEAFQFLYKKTKNTQFLNSCYSSAILALNIQKTDERLQEIKTQAESDGVTSTQNQLSSIRDGIKLAFSDYKKDLHDESEYSNFPKEIPSYDELNFTWLENKLRSN